MKNGTQANKSRLTTTSCHSQTHQLIKIYIDTDQSNQIENTKRCRDGRRCYRTGEVRCKMPAGRRNLKPHTWSPLDVNVAVLDNTWQRSRILQFNATNLHMNGRWCTSGVFLHLTYHFTLATSSQINTWNNGEVSGSNKFEIAWSR